MTQIDFSSLGDPTAPADFGAAGETTRSATPPRRLRLKRNELVEVSEQVAVMLDAGVTVADALECCREQAERDEQEAVEFVLRDVAERVTSGSDLSGALSAHPQSFPSVYVALIRAGEKSGLMTQMLQRAVGYLRDEQEILRKVRGAMTYPAIMFAFAMVTTVSLLIFVLPRFTKLYAGKEHLLPTPTKVLIFLSDLLVHQWHLLVPGVGLAAFGAWHWLRGEAGQNWWHATQLRLPMLGPMFRRLHLSRGLRMLGTLGGAGVGLVDCLDTAVELSTNVWYRALWQDVAEQIRAGRPVSEPLRSTPLAEALVPPAVAQMIKAGEAGGQLSRTAEKVALHAERELKDSVDQITRYIEPAMIVVMGGIIGGVTMALLLPVFTVGRVLAQ